MRQSHLDATHQYFERLGSATIVIARFVPIVRTLAPFLAGAGTMSYSRFALFNIAGAMAWVALLVYAGAFLGSLPLVQEHLSSITMAIVAVSILPMIVAGVRGLTANRSASALAIAQRTVSANHPVGIDDAARFETTQLRRQPPSRDYPAPGACATGSNERISR